MYDSEGLRGEHGSERPVEAHVCLRISPTLKPDWPIQKESPWLRVKFSLWTQVHVLGQFLKVHNSKPTRLAVLWPFRVAFVPQGRGETVNWYSPLCPRSLPAHLVPMLRLTVRAEIWPVMVFHPDQHSYRFQRSKNKGKEKKLEQRERKSSIPFL